jgi:transposase InsO family protein
VDDATLLAHVEVLSDEQKASTVGFLTKALGWFNEQGITSRRILLGNGSAYRSGDWRKACRVLDLNPIRTTPYRLRTNGKADRLIQPLCREWSYAIRFLASDERNYRPPRYLMLKTTQVSHGPG